MGATRRLLMCVSLTSLLIGGCATLNMPWSHTMPRASARNPVMQIVCMWEPSEGRDPNGAPCRGFAGQILFLGNKGGTPVAVDGEVMVYVFDDIGTEEEQAAPVHQFRFDARAWNNHLKVGSLGPAYHCFIPYTRPGNHEANCTVRMKYTPTEGTSSMTSDASHIAMRGKSRRHDGPQHAGMPRMAYETSRPQPQRSPRTTTIPLQNRGTSTVPDSEIQQASYTAPPASSEDRARLVLEEYRREQQARSQQPGATAVAASPRMRLNAQPTIDTDFTESGIVPASYTTEAVSDSHPLSEPPLRTADFHDGSLAPQNTAEDTDPWSAFGGASE